MVCGQKWAVSGYPLAFAVQVGNIAMPNLAPTDDAFRILRRREPNQLKRVLESVTSVFCAVQS